MHKCIRLSELGKQLIAMREEAIGDIHLSVEQFAVHVQTTVSALQDSTIQLSLSFKSVICEVFRVLTFTVLEASDTCFVQTRAKYWTSHLSHCCSSYSKGR